MDLILVYRSEMTCFFCGGRKKLLFSVWIEVIDVNTVFVSGYRNQIDIETEDRN